ncbi:hypothetical protein SmJEL517_g01893 [Synchytrium microbalum]|uniref:Uncharacterized protein n=1 Tax=Synchytrium microbalum TaxID=1806994 RepID=A0A507C852_9FUNG|nr:uncharacterized protein SmJEL517_g01893 [Synchytrium microbalum]TPX35792.1 hypothetical protein SmJEL517_g01893 [Synchytrium microbalum]
MADNSTSGSIESRMPSVLDGASSNMAVNQTQSRRPSQISGGGAERDGPSVINNAANADPAARIGSLLSVGTDKRKPGITFSSVPTTIPHSNEGASDADSSSNNNSGPGAGSDDRSSVGAASTASPGLQNKLGSRATLTASKTSLAAKTVVVHGSRMTLGGDRLQDRVAGAAPAAFGYDFDEGYREGERRIISEDPHFNPAPVTPLVELCLMSVVQNFEAKPRLDRVPIKYRQRLLEAISLTLPLSLAAPLISEESYWERRAKSIFKTLSLRSHGNSWKRLFFELDVREQIENFVPKSSTKDDADEKAFKELVKTIEVSAPWIHNLEIRQLKPKPLAEGKRDEGLPLEHVDLSFILHAIPELECLSLTFDVRDIGMGFAWSSFGISNIDCERLASCLRPPKAKCLTTLCLKSSQLDDTQARILSVALLENTAIKHLDLSNNRIGDAGARGLAKVLATPTTTIKELVLGNNRIGQVGGHALGRCLTRNRTLTSLNMRLNRLGDVGGADFLHVVAHAFQFVNPQAPGKPILQSIDISGNGCAVATLASLCKLVRMNVKTLKSINVSANSLAKIVKSETDGYSVLGMGNIAGAGVNGASEETGPVPVGISATAAKEKQELEDSGKYIVDAVGKNQYLTRLDLRATDIPAASIVLVQELVSENAAIG